MKFSVITVCLNSEETIEKAIKSVINQQGIETEYIIIDGGSNDNTVGIIRKYAHMLAYWHSEPDGGIYDAMNKGISVATGDIISFLNSNDWYAEGALASVSQKMTEGDFDLVCGRVAHIQNGVVVGTSFKPQDERELYYRMFYEHPGIFSKKSVFTQFGGFDLQYKICADYDWLLRVYNAGVHIAYLDALLTYFSLGGASSGLQAAEEKKEICLKHLPDIFYEKYHDRIIETYNRAMLWHKYQNALADIQSNRMLREQIKAELFALDRCTLFGTGFIARACCKLFEMIGIEILRVCDNDEKKQGGKFLEFIVESPKCIQPEERIVIGSTLYAKNIRNQLESLNIPKILDFTDIMQRVISRVEEIKKGTTSGRRWTAMYDKGYCAGVYDLFHIGHVNLFRRAKEQCRYLVVGVLTDELVMHFKKNMPYVPFEERLQMVAACRYVDEAVPVTFETIGKIDAWDRYHYDAFFSGDDYEGNPVWMEEKRLLNERGSDIVFFPYTQTTSSTKIKQAITAQLEQSGNTQ